MKKSYLLLSLAALIALFGCSTEQKTNQEIAVNNANIPAPKTPETTPTVYPTTREYSKNINDLRASFNKDKGKVRLVTLLSPT
jgi:hypothetical protein